MTAPNDSVAKDSVVESSGPELLLRALERCGKTGGLVPGLIDKAWWTARAEVESHFEAAVRSVPLDFEGDDELPRVPAPTDPRAGRLIDMAFWSILCNLLGPRSAQEMDAVWLLLEIREAAFGRRPAP